jgi:hypothetical protein
MVLRPLLRMLLMAGAYLLISKMYDGSAMCRAVIFYYIYKVCLILFFVKNYIC